MSKICQTASGKISVFPLPGLRRLDFPDTVWEIASRPRLGLAVGLQDVSPDASESAASSLVAEMRDLV
jgi:hypothetical protein